MVLLWSDREKALVLGSSGKPQPSFSVMEKASCPGSSVTVAEGTVSSGWEDSPPLCPAALIGMAKEGSRLAFSPEYPHQKNSWRCDFPNPMENVSSKLEHMTERYNQLKIPLIKKIAFSSNSHSHVPTESRGIKSMLKVRCCQKLSRLWVMRAAEAVDWAVGHGLLVAVATSSSDKPPILVFPEECCRPEGGWLAR